MRLRLLAALAAVSICAPALAAETVTYSYDALGRLVTTSTSGSVNNGVATSGSYDAAGNRTNYSVTGASPPPVIVVPLKGLFIIPTRAGS